MESSKLQTKLLNDLITELNLAPPQIPPLDENPAEESPPDDFLINCIMKSITKRNKQKQEIPKIKPTFGVYKKLEPPQLVRSDVLCVQELTIGRK